MDAAARTKNNRRARNGSQHGPRLGWPAKGLHWMAALFILLLLAHGWWMTHMAPRPERLAHYAGHSAMGFDLLALLSQKATGDGA